ncbi:MAG: type II secretion system protein [Deltaproteobacteria bacterium]|nr:type II secretion system protein [Deltaproteobacteria bacterium]
MGDQRGAALLGVLFMTVVLGLGAGVAGMSWQTVVQRAKEEELFYRGDQYRRAIGSYFKGNRVSRTNVFPTKLEELLRDPRVPFKVRHLRKLYPDPMTGKEWEPIRDSGGKIIGVRSSSDGIPFRKDGFPEHYQDFAKAENYADWRFIYSPEAEKSQQEAAPAPAAGIVPAP